MLDKTLSDRPRGALAGAASWVLVLAGASSSPISAQGHGAPGALFTASNDAQGNAVIAFLRDAGGNLALEDCYDTGGAGSGGGLGSQGALALDASGRRLAVVNAGSDTVSVFAVRPHGLELLDVAPSGGSQPISVTIDRDLVYVLNAGGDGNIAGLELSPRGRLSPLAGSTRPLSASATGPAQISFAPSGGFLVVTEKATNTLVTYDMDRNGLPGDPVVTASEGVTPFGFSFDRRSRVLVSEAAGGSTGESTVSSYDLLPDGTLRPVTSALATTQSAACWLVAAGGRYAYVTNTGSGSVTGLAIDRNGSLELLQPTGVSAPSGAGPIDATVTRNGRYLYVLNGGQDSISGYRIGADGSLTPLATVGGLPASGVGLAGL